MIQETKTDLLEVFNIIKQLSGSGADVAAMAYATGIKTGRAIKKGGV